MMRLFVGLLAAVMAAVALPAHAQPSTAHVHVLDTLPIPSFSPDDVTIQVGDSVEWDNHAPRVHTVTHAACPRIDSRFAEEDCVFDTRRDFGRDLNPGDVFEVLFDEPGIFDYVCAIHRFGARITVIGELGTLPDLVVDEVSVFETALRTSKRVQAIVGNDGEASASPSRLYFEIRSIGSAEWARFGDVLVGSLSPGQRRIVNQDLTSFNKIGDFEIRTIADGAGTLVESAEGNNEALIGVSILLPPGSIPGIALPDPPAPEPVTTRIPTP